MTRAFSTRWVAIAVCSFVLLFLSGCGSQQRYVWYSEVPKESLDSVQSTIGRGDKIQVTVAEHPELSGDFLVGSGGHYNHPIVGLIEVAGTTTTQAAERIREKLSRVVVEPTVAVALVERGSVRVAVLGEVKAPGTFELRHGTGLLAALGRAGGLTDFAEPDSIFVVRTSPQAQRIRFRYSDLTQPEPAAMRFTLQDGDAIVVE